MFGLFRKKPLSEVEAEAEALFSQGQIGEAKLAFDRLEERARKEGAAEVAQRAAERAAACCDGIARARIAEAKRMAELGQLEVAREELEHALQTAVSEAVREEVLACQRSLEQDDALEQAQEAAPLSEEERLTLISGSWEPLQAKELESYGEPLMQALLAIDDGRGDDALRLLESVLERAKEPSYLWLEIARARALTGNTEGAAEALRTFVSRIGPEEGGAARLAAHRELARLAHERGDHEAAIAELEACAAALEDDPRPYLDLGNYLRVIKRPREAIEVLELCAGMFAGGTVEWPVTMELGLACADAGETDRAVQALEQVIEQLASRGHYDFPPAPVMVLAKLHEERGNLTRAADLYRALAEGSDVAQHALYHREAARLLEALGLAEEARRMRARAEALAPGPAASAGESEVR